MSQPSTTEKPNRDPDLANAEIAMHRAAQLARERARMHKVGLVYWRDGEIVTEYPSESQPDETDQKTSVVLHTD